MTKQETTYLKGWAVLFMMFLHFGCDFVMPEYRRMDSCAIMPVRPFTFSFKFVADL